ncbi:hypothetical protein HYS31_06875 [Candidatus Woesearchaeota archaeon]|nr:hypothetical protein [Candidatus Woesearchaeota archaeon]
MGHIIKTIISVLIIALFVFLAYLAFSSSLNNDSYIHLLKDSFIEDISNSNNQLVGFKSNFVSSERKIISKYENIPVVSFELKYQKYVCRDSGDDRKCSWETYKTESDSTPFTVDVNNVQVNIKQISDTYFVPKNSAIFDKTQDHRVLQSVIKKSDPIYIWGYLENNEVRVYDDTKHNKKILIITDSARQTLIDSISGVLYIQLLSAVIIIIMTIILFLVNKSWKEKSYIASNYSGLPNSFKKKNIQNMEE